MPCCLADGQEDVAISGSGTIDGQGRQLAQDVIRRVKSGEFIDPMDHNRPNANQRPQLINFRKCRNVRISGVTLRDSSCWVQDYIQCDGLVIENIRVNSTAYWNNDGIDITDCSKVRVSGCDVNSDDDGICLKSEIWRERVRRCGDFPLPNPLQRQRRQIRHGLVTAASVISTCTTLPCTTLSFRRGTGVRGRRHAEKRAR